MKKEIPHNLGFVMKICNCHIGFIGFGHMAQIIFQRLDVSKAISHSQILFIGRDPQKMKENEKKFGIAHASLKKLVEKSDILLLGIRPSQTEAILQEMSALDLTNKLIITVVAGKTLSLYEKYFGSNASILRVMPNIASSVGEGMSVLSYGKNITSEHKSLARLIFSSLGQIIEVDESLMDISCAIAGSGPGFVFSLIEAMARAGESQGLSYPQALQMSAQVFLGASRLILEGNLPEDLLHKIATPQGTTQAGLSLLKETQMEKHMQKVVEAALKRSKELSIS